MRCFTILPLLILLMSTTPVAHADETDDLALEARQIIKEFRTRLKFTINVGMQDAGIPGTIDGCAYLAPEIAQEISLHEGWLVGRTSLNTRNRANKPDPWESRTLMSFEQQHADGIDLESLEAQTVEQDQQGRRFRFMMAIPADNECLSCHGTEISDVAARKLGTHYKQDQTRGDEPGGIRGAFTLTKDLD